MSKVRVGGYAVSIDGFAAGPDQSLEFPLGKRGPEIFQWYFPTRTMHQMTGKPGGTEGVDNRFGARSMEGFGAFILGRNMFGPIRGAWPDEDWKGWWGPNPPYHAPTFILTNYARDPIEMEGGTVFHFVTGGIEEALTRARQAAGDLDVKIGGGASTVRQYLEIGAIDEMHLAMAPVLLGRGEPLLAGLDLSALGYKVVSTTPGENATHIMIGRAQG